MIDIQLDGPSTSGPPSVTLTTENVSEVVVGVANVADYQQRDFDSGELLTWDDGGPKLGKVVTGIIVTATDCTVPDGDDLREAAPGDVVSFWCERGKWFPYRDAVAAAGGVNVGDVMRWARLEDDAPKKRGHNGKKNFDVKIRRPEARDGDLADRCVALYHELKARPAVDAPAAPGPFDGGSDPADPGF